MENTRVFGGILASLFSFALVAAEPSGAWSRASRHESASAGTLRGFGACTVVEETWTKGGLSAQAVWFGCTSVLNAETVIGKFRFDLLKSPDVVAREGLYETAGGATFALVRGGLRAGICSADSRAALAAFLADDPARCGSVVPAPDCPAWMKRFGWGTYGMGGFDGSGGLKLPEETRKGPNWDPREDYDFHEQMGNLHFDAWMECEAKDDSDGILAQNGQAWKTKYAQDRGIPYGVRTYLPSGSSFAWVTRRFSEYMEQPAPWTLNAWLRYGSAYEPHFSWFQTDIYGYLGRLLQDNMRKFASSSVTGWMHPVGELVHQPWYDMHADYSPAAKTAWHRWLKDHGVTLAEAGEMYSRPGPFLSWDQVEVPEFATFAGLPGCVLDLEGLWFSSSNRTDWVGLQMPGNRDYLKYYEKEGGRRYSKTERFMRRSFDWDPACSKGDRVYLYFFPMSSEATRHEVWLNGELVAEIGQWCALDVTDRLKLGANEIEFLLRGHFWKGRVFLSTQEPAVYPNLGRARNRMFRLWNDWRRDVKYHRSEELFDAMRQVDPNATVKFMAPLGFGFPLTNRLMTEWGGFSHFTGEGVWYFPWYKRSGKLWGYPGTSELGGPYVTVADARRSALRVFLAGLDLHEPVFITQVYSRNASVRDWWLSHRHLLQRMGTYDIFGPQVLLYRRSTLTLDRFPSPEPRLGPESHRVNAPWDWDLGRGSLQSIGQSMLYIDDDGLAAGKMYGHKLMVDCGNEVVDPENFDAIADWVKDGGTYVAWPFTGRSESEVGDAWPIANIAGAKVSKIRSLGGTVTWKGKTYRDAGRVVIGNGVEANEYSVELEPTDPETTVLATYENGKPAVTLRRFGRGKVIWFGSAFWRDAGDVEGIWWPGAGESAFLKELLDDLGFDAPLCETDDLRVWAQPYRSNNGLDAVTCLCNFNTNGVQNVNVSLRLPRRPQTLFAYSGNGVERPAFDWKDGLCTFRVTLPAQEVMVVNAPVYRPQEAVGYWWKENQVAWRPLKQPTRDFSAYREGKWKDPTQDLKYGWTFADGRPCVCDVLQFWGLPDGEGATIRKTFDVTDADWFKGGRIRLSAGAWFCGGFRSPTRVVLNGVTLAEKAGEGTRIDADVTELLKPMGNVLEMICAKPSYLFTGFTGAIYLYHREAPAESFKLNALPTKVFVPAEWKTRYKVFVRLETEETEPQPPLGVKIADRVVRKHHHNFRHITEIDVSNDIVFGAENEFRPYGREPKNGWNWSKIDARLELRSR